MSPQEFLGGLDAEATGTLIAAATDIALVIDTDGVIRDVAFGNDEFGQWIGRHWTDTVTTESKPKVEALLRDAALSEGPTRRHINHPLAGGSDVPVLYSAVRVGRDGHVVAVGRDLRSVASLQQRLIDAQQAIERDHWRLRHLETRYRVLFQMTSEPIIVVEALSRKIVEANPAAMAMLGNGSQNPVGRMFPDHFDADSNEAVLTMLAGLRATGRSDDVRAASADGRRAYIVSASLVRTETAPLFLVRVVTTSGEAPPAPPQQSGTSVLSVVNALPDGLVVTDLSGRILTANQTFLEMTQLTREDQATGELLGQWLGQHGLDFSVLMANLRNHDTVRLFPTTLRDTFGTSRDVEISAVAVPNGDPPCLGFLIRQATQRLAPTTVPRRELPRSIDQLSELVGRVPLKDLVREATDVIERLCIEAALELTRDNRASAAELLGLSRQSLYVKLRRFGLADQNAEAEGQE